MKCSKSKKLIVQQLDGTLKAAAASRLENHLGDCAGCRQYREEVSSLVQSLRSAPEPEKSDAFWNSFSDSVRARIRREDTTRTYRPAAPVQRSPMLRPVPALVPAMILLVVAAAFFFSRPQAPDTTTAEIPASEIDVLLTMFDNDTSLSLPASESVTETDIDYTEYYESVEVPSGFFNGGDRLLGGATPADFVNDLTDDELEEIYEKMRET